VYVLAQPSARRTIALVLLAIPIVLVGPSRLYLGQHWLSDVLGGYAVAAMLLVPYCWAYTKWRLDATRRRFKHSQSATDVPTQRRRHIGGPSTAVTVATNHEQGHARAEGKELGQASESASPARH